MTCLVPPPLVLIVQPKFEAIMSEVDIVVNELHHAIANLSSWIQPDYVSKNLVGTTPDLSQLKGSQMHIYVITIIYLFFIVQICSWKIFSIPKVKGKHDDC